MSPEIHYKDSFKLINKINISTLFANNIEKTITAEEIRNTFDVAFAEGSGKKVNVKCDTVGLWVNLRADINKDDNLIRLLQNAPAVNNISCTSGMVDAVEF